MPLPSSRRVVTARPTSMSPTDDDLLDENAEELRAEADSADDSDDPEDGAASRGGTRLTDDRPPRLWRPVIDSLLAVALLGLVLVGALRWWDTTIPLVIIAQTAGPFVVIGLALLAVTTLLLRRWVLVAATIVSLGASLMIALPPWFASTTPDHPRAFTVMSSNLMYGNATPTQLMAAVRTRAADVLVLQEATPEAVNGLRDEGLDTYFEHSVGEARPNSAAGTMIFSRFPLEEVPTRVTDSAPFLQPDVFITMGSERLRLRAVHPLPPTSGRTADWHQGLTELREWRDEAGQGPMILAGDFNADYGHPVFRRLAEGMVDANRGAGQGWVRTWPVVGQRMPPYVALDHVLSQDLVLIDAGVTKIHGTDHAIVWGAYGFTTEK